MACKVLTWHCRRRTYAEYSYWLCVSSVNSVMSHLTVFFAASLPSKCPLSGIYYGAKNRLAAKGGLICCRMGQVQT